MIFSVQCHFLFVTVTAAGKELGWVINPACNCRTNAITLEIAFRAVSTRILIWILYVLQPESFAFAFAWIHRYVLFLDGLFASFAAITAAAHVFSSVFPFVSHTFSRLFFLSRWFLFHAI